MTNNPPDIIEVVKELQTELKCIATPDDYWKPGEPLQLAREWIYKVISHYPAIAAALLDREQKLQIAVEALEKERRRLTDFHQLRPPFSGGCVDGCQACAGQLSIHAILSLLRPS